MSKEGFGLTFWINIQFPVVAEKKDSKKVVLNQVQENLRILVDEDNSVHQMIVKIMLEKLGHFVTVISNGLEALEALKFTSCEIVLMQRDPSASCPMRPE